MVTLQTSSMMCMRMQNSRACIMAGHQLSVNLAVCLFSMKR